MGVSNACSSVLGGLTIIPGIVKSTANILGGGRTQWANFYNACFLLTFLLLGRELINLVPMAILAILVFVGFKLCRPKVWRHVAHVGREHLFVFTVTVLVTVSEDLLVGIAVGVGLELVLAIWYVGLWHTLSNGSEFAKPNFGVRFLSLFRNPVSQRELVEGTYHLYLDGPLVCFNLFHVIRELGQLPHDTRAVYLHLSSRVPLVDHTTGESLRYYLEEFSGQDQSPKLVIEGWDHMRSLSKHETSTRIAIATVEKVAVTDVEKGSLPMSRRRPSRIEKVAFTDAEKVAFADRAEHELRVAQTTD